MTKKDKELVKEVMEEEEVLVEEPVPEPEPKLD